MKPARALPPALASLFAFTCCVCILRSYPADKPKNVPTGASVNKDRVETKDFMFKPAALTVVAGTNVTFVNRDEMPHSRRKAVS